MSSRQRALFCIGPTRVLAACSDRVESDRIPDPLGCARSKSEHHHRGSPSLLRG